MKKLASDYDMDISDIVDNLQSIDYGEHVLLVYPDIMTFRSIYSSFVKTELQDKNNALVILPFYETLDSVRVTLLEGGLNVRKYEEDQSLMIINSTQAYFESDIGLLSFLNIATPSAEIHGKNGVTAIMDVGSFFLFERIEELIKRESMWSQKTKVKIKQICAYNQGNFNQLTDSEKSILFECHFKSIDVNHIH